MIASNKVAVVAAFLAKQWPDEYGPSSGVSRKQIAHGTGHGGNGSARRRMALSDADRRQLERWAHGRMTPQRLALRSRIILLAARGLSLRDISTVASASVRTVVLWRKRFAEGGLQSLLADAPGRGRKPSIALETRQAIAAECMASLGTRRAVTVRATALKYGVGRSTVQRIWSKVSTPRGKRNSGTGG